MYLLQDLGNRLFDVVVEQLKQPLQHNLQLLAELHSRCLLDSRLVCFEFDRHKIVAAVVGVFVEFDDDYESDDDEDEGGLELLELFEFVVDCED